MEYDEGEAEPIDMDALSGPLSDDELDNEDVIAIHSDDEEEKPAAKNKKRKRRPANSNSPSKKRQRKE